MKKLIYEMILGMEFLARHRAIINCTGVNVQLSLEEVVQIATIKRLTREEAKARVADILAENKELFKDSIGRVNHYVHKIKINTHLPFKTKNYPIPEVHREAVTKYINDLEEEGIVEWPLNI